MSRLLLYTTSGCHLCEQAEQLISPFLKPCGLVLERVEISGSDALLERYGLRIPVVRLVDSGRELAWPFDEESFIRFVDSYC